MNALARNPSYSDRPHDWVEPKVAIQCPHMFGEKKHHVHTNARIQSHGLIRCEHRPGPGAGECGAWVWLTMVPSGWRYVTIVSPAEIAYMEHRHMTVDESLAYLGTEIPPEAR